jgi:hypothetical protein
MKYKEGDKVRVKSIQWYGNGYGRRECGHYAFTPKMSNLCGDVVTITEVGRYGYRVDCLKIWWTDEMFDGGVEPEKIPDNTKKYGQKDEDIITICQNRGLSFCYGNALKYARRIAMVAEMPEDEKYLYKHTYHKGGQLDLDKMEDYIKREAEVNKESAEFLFEECMEILDGVV